MLMYNKEGDNHDLKFKIVIQRSPVVIQQDSPILCCKLLLNFSRTAETVDDDEHKSLVESNQ